MEILFYEIHELEIEAVLKMERSLDFDFYSSFLLLAGFDSIGLYCYLFNHIAHSAIFTTDTIIILHLLFYSAKNHNL